MLPRYTQIKLALLDAIEDGTMGPGDQVPSENQLALQHQVSRMTARRAVTELVEEGILMRTQGLGTFVSDHRPMSSMLEIRSIRDEVIQRGHRYASSILHLDSVIANEALARWLDVGIGDVVFHSIIVHSENGQPIQYEERWVNPRWAPDYLQQDFSQQTANHYLNLVAPLTQADHSVEAMLPEAHIAQALQITAADPCLKISRRTYSARGVVSHAVLYHPGNRYRLGGHLNFQAKT
ncbi:histidine utilization repressor [Aestuariibacter halophilus]|uniref:Histidine utilization repressor n=1 Tax=Fluctibacter halophilus TaxID=226011 RepID=A0ABS8GAE1_9ALTE|nr:histidine utilization repressor [Aestuariibacter halophilus]MCC2617483.1 histidine utilization repressor [Aestuariibacter halophilus]